MTTEQELELFRTIVGTTLSTYLGKYTWTINGNQQDTPALTVVLDPDIMPSCGDRHTTGIECLIFPPTPHPDPYLGGGVHIYWEWTIRLIQHDRSKTLIDCQRALIRRLPRMTVRSRSRSNQEGNEEITFVLMENEVIGSS